MSERTATVLSWVLVILLLTAIIAALIAFRELAPCSVWSVFTTGDVPVRCLRNFLP